MFDLDFYLILVPEISRRQELEDQVYGQVSATQKFQDNLIYMKSCPFKSFKLV